MFFLLLNRIGEVIYNDCNTYYQLPAIAKNTSN